MFSGNCALRASLKSDLVRISRALALYLSLRYVEL